MVKRAEETDRFPKEYARAARRGISVVEPAAQRARYDAKTDRIVVELRSGIALAIPSALIQGLAEATRSARREVIVTGGGVGLYWPTLDLDIDVMRTCGRHLRQRNLDVSTRAPGGFHDFARQGEGRTRKRQTRRTATQGPR